MPPVTFWSKPSSQWTFGVVPTGYVYIADSDSNIGCATSFSWDNAQSLIKPFSKDETLIRGAQISAKALQNRMRVALLNRASQYQKDGKSMRTFEKAIQTNHDENTYKAVPFKTKLTAFVHWIRYDLITSLVSMWGTPQYIHKNDLQVSDNDVVSAEYHDVPQYSALPCPALKV
ncbi:uncharacterized protein ARMOST_11489 [Armillaria ostoyae]|uniref:Uncharacterized protein n=1 Tax=Armillaria ostoyae TaxID=47428 RepID=A0A284RHA1_ARMOS|nr:uncharacterized protein ARMOST_11489 [Armillaria ostoyae]